MSEKQAKLERREASKIIGGYRMDLLADGRVTVSGDLDNFLLFRDVMNKAERAVLDRLAAKLQNKMNNRIVVPSLDVKGLKIVL